MFIPLKDRVSKLPQICKFLAYSYTAILIPTYDNGTYGNTRISKDIIFDESLVFNNYIDNSRNNEKSAVLPHNVVILNPKKVTFAD